MSESIEVCFDIPDEIQDGLDSGRYVRDGGTILDAKTKRIVKRLDEIPCDPPPSFYEQCESGGDGSVFDDDQSSGLEDWFLDRLGELTEVVVRVSIITVADLVSQWWCESGKDAVRIKVAKIWGLLRKRKAGSVDAANISNNAMEGSLVSVQRPVMSKDEAQARLLVAIAANAYAERQKRLVQESAIADGVTFEQVVESLAELPETDLKQLVMKLTQDPSLLNEHVLASVPNALQYEAEQRSLHTVSDYPKAD